MSGKLGFLRNWRRHIGIQLGLRAPLGERGYMICATPRSGSNYLSQLLASTGVLGTPREYFNAPGRRHYDDPTYPDDPHEQLRQIMTTGRTPNGIYAVKAHPFQLAALGGRVDPLTELPDLRFVLLQRRDLIAQAISWSRAQQTKQHRTTDLQQQECRYHQAHIRKSLSFLLTHRARWKKLLRKIKAKPQLIEYEDLLCNPQQAAERVARLVEIDDQPRINTGLVTVTIQRDAINDEWRSRFLAETGEEFRNLAAP